MVVSPDQLVYSGPTAMADRGRGGRKRVSAQVTFAAGGGSPRHARADGGAAWRVRAATDWPAVVLGPGMDATPADLISNHDAEHDQEGERGGRQRGSAGSVGQRPAVARLGRTGPAQRGARPGSWQWWHGVTTRTDGAGDVHDY
jgi:hypothetical protein